MVTLWKNHAFKKLVHIYNYYLQWIFRQVNEKQNCTLNNTSLSFPHFGGRRTQKSILRTKNKNQKRPQQKAKKAKIKSHALVRPRLIYHFRRPPFWLTWSRHVMSFFTWFSRRKKISFLFMPLSEAYVTSAQIMTSLVIETKNIGSEVKESLPIRLGD